MIEQAFTLIRTKKSILQASLFLLYFNYLYHLLIAII